MSATAQRVFARLDGDGVVKVSVDAVSLPRHYQSASALLSQARTYRREGALEAAYVLHRRFMVYTLRTIHKHPQYNSARYAKEKAAHQLLAQATMDALEELRAHIALKYADDVRPVWEEEDDEEPAHEDEHLHQPVQSHPPHYEQEEKKECQPPAHSHAHAHTPPLADEDGRAGSGEGAAFDAALEARMAALVLSTDEVGSDEHKEDYAVTSELPSVYRQPSPPPASLIATAFTLTPGLSRPPEPSAPAPEDAPPPLPPLPVVPSSTPSTPPESVTPPSSRSPADTRQKWSTTLCTVKPSPPSRRSAVTHRLSAVFSASTLTLCSGPICAFHRRLLHRDCLSRAFHFSGPSLPWELGHAVPPLRCRLH